MRVLLHCCCGPCTTGVLETFTARGEAVEGWYYNPNIAPGEEWQRRRESFHQAAEALGLSRRREEEAPRLADFLLALARGGGRRCRACYRLRLATVARTAAAEGYDAFSTTLSISPYQDLKALAEVGQEVGEECGVSFTFLDLRASFPKSRRVPGSWASICRTTAGACSVGWSARCGGANGRSRRRSRGVTAALPGRRRCCWRRARELSGGTR